jgi:hypothetical protein
VCAVEDDVEMPVPVEIKPIDVPQRSIVSRVEIVSAVVERPSRKVFEVVVNKPDDIVGEQPLFRQWNDCQRQEDTRHTDGRNQQAAGT